MKARDLDEIVRRINDLPDDAILPDPASARMMGISVSTLKRLNPVASVRISQRIYGRRLGDIRALSRGNPQSAA
jgi:hypothetical protein